MKILKTVAPESASLTMNPGGTSCFLPLLLESLQWYGVLALPYGSHEEGSSLTDRTYSSRMIAMFLTSNDKLKR